ncbi:hypothetical protein P167DRAFT_218324 [Morchella conica CCBAS932]|uniref:Beta-lactamase-related domain-containing protein n=1 Tax=Morchella conica CCBAS932 TaxID=1392247 RepID=A0A3N4KM27_9PEZI|nr:hypothetical protein P167DRAFT_218324 [Morchella conica CCBAS932]
MIQLSHLLIVLFSLQLWCVCPAQAAASTSHHGPDNHHILKRSALNLQRPTRPSNPTAAATYDKYNVRSDDSWWCGLGAVGSPAEYHPDSIYPVNHLFTAAAVSKTMAMVVGLGRGNFRKYPGNFMNRDPAGKTLLPDIVLSPGFTLKYFPILHDGSKWAPVSLDKGLLRGILSVRRTDVVGCAEIEGCEPGCG